MKLVSKLNTIAELELIQNYSDCIMLPYELISIENIEKINKYNKTPILMYNLMIHPFELNKYTNEILKYINSNTLFYITDLGLARFLKNNNLIDRVIYDPITMITNSLDAKNYYEYGFNAIGLSNEITFNDLNEIISKTDINAFYQVFGHRLMLHSRRKLVSLYKEKIGDKSPNTNMQIIETTRNDVYPIVENDRGTYIYRSYLISLIKEIKGSNIEYAFFENFNTSLEVYYEIIKIYYEYLNDNISLNLALEKISLLNLDIKDGFTYQDSVYQKEEF